MSYNPTDIEKEAIELVRAEKNLWYNGTVFLTEQIYVNTRDVIKRARKNYFGIFDNSKDPVTGRRKLNVPMTRDMVETTVKNLDIDTKDINTKAKNPGAYGLATISRYLLSTHLDKMRFGQTLNRIIRKASTEGVGVIKKFNNPKTNMSLLENLNFLTDPTVNYLRESTGNIERNWLTKSEMRGYDWNNLEDCVGTTSIERVDLLPITTSLPYNDISERWGLVPLYFFTKNEKDRNEFIEAVIVISNLSQAPVVHLIAQNKTGKRPYQEFRTKVYDGRWLGIGIPEDLFDLQAYLNEVFNLRLNTARIKQLGLFEIRRGAGITSQMLSQLYSGGAIQVSRIGQDIAELRTSDIRPSSYKDEEQAYLWAQRMTGAWEVGRGETLPASTPATVAVLQQQGMNSGFSLQQEELGFAISQFIEELILPDLLKNLDDKEIQRITGDPKELRIIDDMYIDSLVNEEILKYNKKNGYYPSLDEIQREKDVARQKFMKFGRDRFVQIKKALFSPENIIDSVDVFITDESFNKAVIARQLNDLLLNYSKIGGISIDSDSIVAELLDIMGLGSERFLKSKQEVQQQQAGMQQQAIMQQLAQQAQAQTKRPTSMAAISPTEQAAEVMTPEMTGRAAVPTL